MNAQAQLLAMPANSMARRMRSPRHPFMTKASLFQIVPFFIAQVLPGETLKQATVQARAISAPIKNDLIGCAAEMYFYYIPLRFLEAGFVDMVVDPDFDAAAAGYTATADATDSFFAASVAVPGINYVDRCLQHVVQHYFRDEDEAIGAHLINGRYAARINSNSVAHSLAPASEYAVADIDIDLDADATVTAAEASKAMAMWQMMVSQGRTDKSYQDYLRSYGIKETKTEATIGEEIRVMREWKLPMRLVEPSTGVPTAAWMWDIQERIDKARFMKEPGFLFGVQVYRPKVFLRNLKGTTTAYLQSALSWLPGEVLNSLAYGLPEFAAAQGPVEAASASYMFDLRDLLMYGEQFVNFDLASTSHGIVALPSADLTNNKYVSWADVQAMFSGANYDVTMDGIVSLQIASRLGGDLTPAA